MSKLIVVDGKPVKFQIWDTAGNYSGFSDLAKIFKSTY